MDSFVTGTMSYQPATFPVDANEAQAACKSRNGVYIVGYNPSGYGSVDGDFEECLCMLYSI